uniref:Protein quiver n=1 Tax=Onchocerca volvulus TaxID=6282 RepID=A0A8R1TK18_ONCVO
MSIIVTSIIFQFLLLLYSEAFHCYYCVSNLPSNISKDAQRAFRTVLYSTFVVPPVHRSCINPQDIEFATVKQVDCSSDDQCIKITVWQKDLQFVMRSCQKLIYRDKIISDNVRCRHDDSPSICRCSSNLCNSALIFSLHNYIFSLTFLMVLSIFA